MTQPLDKTAAKRAVLLHLQEQLELLRKAVSVAVAATTHPDAKAEGKYDTRAIESGYLAGAQAKRLEELESKIRFLAGFEIPSFDEDDEIAPGAMVACGGKWFWILPQIGGFQVTVDRAEVTVITPQSRLGSELIGCLVGDEVAGNLIEALL